MLRGLDIIPGAVSDDRRVRRGPEPPALAPERSPEVLGRIPPVRRQADNDQAGDPLSESAIERRERTRASRPDPRAEDDNGPVIDHVRPTFVDAVGTASIPPKGPRPGLSPDQRATKLVDELKICGPGDEGPLMAPLLALGDDALLAAIAAFPGARWFNRYRPHVRMPKGYDLSPICRLLVAFGEQAVPYVLPLIESVDADDRYMGALVAGDIGHADFVMPLGRMLFDPDPTLRDAAVHGLSEFGPSPAFDLLSDQLRAHLASPQTADDYRLFALRAVGVMRLRAALAEVIPLVATGSSHVREAARRVLLTLTGNDLGDDVKKWRAWRDRHGHEPRAAWLVAGLGHPAVEVREVALRELERLTGERLDFDPKGGWLVRFRGRLRWQRWLGQNPHAA